MALRLGAALSFMSFAEITDERVINCLIHALNDEFDLVRAPAAFALGVIRAKGRQAIEPLLKATYSDDESLRLTATHALSNILMYIHE